LPGSASGGSSSPPLELRGAKKAIFRWRGVLQLAPISTHPKIGKNMRFAPLLKRIYNKIPSFSNSGRHSLGFLNITQFLGIINDNVFKFVMAFLLIDTLGFSKASSILSATGAIYVIPFLLFSSSAGILADRFSKQKLLVVMKLAEMILMTLAIFAFASKTIWGCYTLLFLLSMHSAIFGPSKYSIIPELVPKDSVSKANGLITSFTYLAMIIGTFLASFLTEITERHFTLIAIFCLIIAIGGFFSSLGIKQTLAQGSDKKINIFFVREIYQTLKGTRNVRHLLPAIFGSAYFLMIGAFTQLNIIPFALQSLNLSEISGGYLFLGTALGIALGSFIAGRISRKRVELGLSCLAGFGISLFFILLSIFSWNLHAVIICLLLIGILGGAFIVPLDTFIQLNSDGVKRGQTIGAANFLSFLGVLLASFALYFFSQICGLSSAASFFVMGLITFCFSTFLSSRFSDLFFSFFSRIILYPLLAFKRPEAEEIEKASKSILILENATWRNALLLTGLFPTVHLLIPADSKKWHWYLPFFFSIRRAPEEKNIEEIISQAKKFQEQGIVSCLMLNGTPSKPETNAASPFFKFFKRNSQAFYVHFIKDRATDRQTVQFEKREFLD
jgi:acyl-[acyl-carrier-protein]-phospholipid O-acyltransferase/long-chain-fatty-acid--[acyl-carrier-protein] ligase